MEEESFLNKHMTADQKVLFPKLFSIDETIEEYELANQVL